MDKKLTQNLSQEEKEKLYKEFTAQEPSSTISNKPIQQNHSEYPLDCNQKIHSVNKQTLLEDFQNLKFAHKCWYYIISIFSYKRAEYLFSQDQISTVLSDIEKYNSSLIQREKNIPMISTYLPDRLQVIFKQSKTITPLINEIEQNSQLEYEISKKIIFMSSTIQKIGQFPLHSNHFIDNHRLQEIITYNKNEIQTEITKIYNKVKEESEFLPMTLYKYAADTFYAIKQCQKICQFPFSTFFHMFQTNFKEGKIDSYDSILPNAAHVPIGSLLELIYSVGHIKINEKQLRRMINLYLTHIEESNDENNCYKHSIEIFNNFMNIQNTWNAFIAQIPIDKLYLYTSGDLYQEIPETKELYSQILEKMPQKMKKIYQDIIAQSITFSMEKYHLQRVQQLLSRYRGDNKEETSLYYNNNRTTLIPIKISQSKRPIFAYCKSYMLTKHILESFCKRNIFKPLHLLSKYVFRSQSKLYNQILEFLIQMENIHVALKAIEHKLEPDHHSEVIIKDIVRRVEHNSIGAINEYHIIFKSIDSSIYKEIENFLSNLDKLTEDHIPSISKSIEDEAIYQKFKTFIPQFRNMDDFENPIYTPITPEQLLNLWALYVKEIKLLVENQLSLEDIKK